MTAEELVDFLHKEVKLFEGFEVPVLEKIVAASELRTFEGNEAIIECGDSGSFFGVLVSGHAAISVSDTLGSRNTINQLEAGEVFGEMSLLTGDRTVADVIAGNRCFVLMIPHDTFNTLILVRPQAITYLSKLLADRTRAQALDLSSRQLQERAMAQSTDPYALSLKTEVQGKILALNVGLNQVHFGVYDTQDDSRDVHGILDLGDAGTAHITLTAGGQTLFRDRAPFPLEDFLKVLFESMQTLADKFLFTPFDVIAVGHRVVHGGSKFSSAVVVTPQVMADIEALNVFAPLHNPHNLLGMREAQRYFPNAPHIAVFDTAFHQTLPTYAYLYGLPYEMYKQDGVRRYGFHGTSHRYVSLKSAEFLKRPLGELDIVSCHLGIGASMCAIDHGRSVDTTMGMTPSDGLIMSTRAGSIDPAVIVHLMEQRGMTPEAVGRLINQQSGLLGISGISSHMQDIEEAASEGHHRALLAHKAYCYQIRKTIGGYIAAMGGVDVIAFTGEIGETSSTVRSLACQGLAPMGIRIDEEKNRSLGLGAGCVDIATDDSPVRVLVIANNDERLLAWEALRALERHQLLASIAEQPQDPITIEVSAHHVHLAQADVEKLFGPGHQLTPEHELSQPGQFACAEKVDLVGPKGKIANVRVLGPTRKETQVEIAMTEQFKLGIQPPIRESGDLSGTPGVTLQGPAGSSVIPHGVICAQRHIHMSPEDAMRLRVRDKYVVRVRVEGDRELVYGDVVVRVNPNYRLAMHIDTDEGNAASIRTGMQGFIEEIQSRG
jgi:acetate kinase